MRDTAYANDREHKSQRVPRKQIVQAGYVDAADGEVEDADGEQCRQEACPQPDIGADFFGGVLDQTGQDGRCYAQDKHPGKAAVQQAAETGHPKRDQKAYYDRHTADAGDGDVVAFLRAACRHIKRNTCV